MPVIPMPASVWQDRGACRGMDTRLFFGSRDDTPVAADIVALCDGCEVRTQCLEQALATDPASDIGVWAGTNRMQRREIRRLRLRLDADIEALTVRT